MRRLLAFVAFVIGYVLLSIFILMLAWNAVVPDVLHLSAITFWQAFLLALVCNLLFGHKVSSKD